MSYSKIRVAVLRGGTSNEYPVSLQTGSNVLRNLPEKYHPIDVFIDKSGTWHVSGLPKSPEKILSQADVVFNALHGTFGEDGTVQKIFETHGIPYVGSSAFPSILAFNKSSARKIFEHAGLKVPHGQIFTESAKENKDVSKIAAHIFMNFPMPVIIKPARGGSSIAVSLARTIPEIMNALTAVFAITDTALVEEFISGKEASVGVIDNFREQKTYALLPVEIHHDREFFDYDAKYSGATKEICPGNFSKDETHILEEAARKAHQALGLRHYSRSDFIVHPKRGVFILETNSLPGLTEESIFPKALAAVGATPSQFIDHVLTQAMN